MDTGSYKTKHAVWPAMVYLCTYVQMHGLNYWFTPASITNINPIKCVGADLKPYIAWRVKPLTETNTVKGMLQFS